MTDNVESVKRPVPSTDASHVIGTPDEDDGKSILVPSGLDTLYLCPTEETKKSNFASVLAGGMGMMSDGYQNSLLQTSNILFKKIYGTKVYTGNYSAQIANALLVGIILGEAFFGFVTDLIGRKAAVMATTGFLIVGGLLGTVAHAPTPQGLFWFLTIARGITGFGSGGEYPAAQTSSIEGADAHYSVKRRGFVFLMSTIACLLAGQMLTYIVCLIGLAASNYDGTRNVAELHKLEIIWRCEWAFGVLLPIFVLFFRMRLMSSALFKRNSIKRNVPYWLFIKKYWPRLLGSTGSFFFSQFIGYPGSTFSGIIISGIAPDATTITTVAWTFCLTCFNIPGLFVGAWCTGFLDRRWQLGIGFTGFTVLGCVIGGLYEKITPILPLFVVIYGLYLSCGAFGPGNLNGLLVSEAYPTSMRGTAHGMVAALGKVGGVCGTFAFTHVSKTLGVKYTFIVGGCVATVGILCAAFLTPNTLESSLSDIDEEWRMYLEENGWQGFFGESAQEHRNATDNKAVVMRDHE